MKASRDELRIAAGAGLLFVASFVVYWPAIHGQFLWDDVLNILQNPLLRSSRGLLGIWLGDRFAYDYYPLTWTTWWIEWHAWRRETTGYHVLNILLHAGAAGLLWRAMARLSIPGAFIAAMVFAVHPINVESVAWISERKNTLSMFLLAVALVLHLDGEVQTDTGRRKGFYWGSVGAFALALLSKPSVVMFPFVLLAVAWWRRGRVKRADVWRLAPFAVLAGAISLLTVYVHHGRGIGGVDVRADGFFGRLAGAGWAVWFYLYKLLWPVDLAFIYPRWKVDPQSPAHWLPLVALLATFAALYAGRRLIGRGPLVALSCYVAMLLPVLGFFDVYFFRFSLVADHWQYPACLAVIAAIAAGAIRVLSRLQVPQRVMSVVLIAVTCVPLTILARQNARHFQTNETLWGEAIRDNPRATLARINYASAIRTQPGREGEAWANYRLAVELDPAIRDPYAAIGEAYVLDGKPADAIPWFRQAVGRPGAGRDPRIGLAQALAATGARAEAVEWYEKALADDPVNAGFRPSLAALHAEAGHADRAITLYREDVRYWPDDPEAWFALVVASANYGGDDNAKEARAALAEARRLHQGDHVALNALGTRLLAVGHFILALDPLRDAIVARDDYGPAYNNLGKALEALGRPVEAASAYADALRVQPGFREAQLNLGRVQPGPGTRPAS